MRLFARLVFTGLIVGVAISGYAAYRIWEQGNRDDRRPADAIVVMGAAQYDGRPSPVFAAMGLCSWNSSTRPALSLERLASSERRISPTRSPNLPVSSRTLVET